MPSFDEFLNALKENIEEFARANWNEYVNAVVDDSDAFLNKAKKDMERWTGLLAMGQLTKEDFEWLVNGKKDLAEMEALKQHGLAQVKLDRCKEGLLNIVVKTAFKMFT